MTKPASKLAAIADMLVTTAEMECGGDREAMYLVLNRACAAFAATCRKPEPILRMMAEALTAGADAAAAAPIEDPCAVS